MDRDKGGNILQLGIETDDFVKYVIIDKKVEKRLAPYIGQKIKVTGNISDEYLDERQVLIVNDFRIIR